jgi:hypothetical protein
LFFADFAPFNIIILYPAELCIILYASAHTRVKNANSAGYKFGHLILHTDKGYELTIPVNHNPLYVLAAVGNLGASVVPFRNRSNSPPVAE